MLKRSFQLHLTMKNKKYLGKSLKSLINCRNPKNPIHSWIAKRMVMVQINFVTNRSPITDHRSPITDAFSATFLWRYSIRFRITKCNAFFRFYREIQCVFILSWKLFSNWSVGKKSNLKTKRIGFDDKNETMHYI